MGRAMGYPSSGLWPLATHGPLLLNFLVGFKMLTVQGQGLSFLGAETDCRVV